MGPLGPGLGAAEGRVSEVLRGTLRQPGGTTSCVVRHRVRVWDSESVQLPTGHLLQGEAFNPSSEITAPASAPCRLYSDFSLLLHHHHQLEKLQKAASAAHTYFVANPSHLEMRNNIEKYRRMEGVTDEDFLDREMENEKHWVRRGGGRGRGGLFNVPSN